MSYGEAIEYLRGLGLYGARLGLENAIRLAHFAGDPHKNLRFIHVAGTNGKGSTCAMLESIYRHAGLKVGLFTSPHLVSFSERMQIDRVPIGRAEVADLVCRLRDWISQGWNSPTAPADLEHPPTFFEAVTIMALVYFAEQRCDLVIWETGLGGRLDATNIVTPMASVVTNVQWDHQEWLGATLKEIAFEKAGIIKDRVPVFTATSEQEALDVIRRVAFEKNAPLTEVNERELPRLGLDAISLPLAGAHQQLNAALAISVVLGLEACLPVSRTILFESLARVVWRGRFEVFERPDGGTLVVDGAHNPGGAAAFCEALRARYPLGDVCLIFGVFADKDWRSMIRSFAALPHRVVLVPIQSERSARTEDLKSVWSEVNPDANIQLVTGLREALEVTSNEPLTVVVGSLYLAGECIGLLSGSSIGESHIEEITLNESGKRGIAVSDQRENGS